jgi:hypothetical protein
MLDGLRFAQCHRENAKQGYQEGPKDCCAHVESNHVDIGEYRLKQDNKVFLRDLTGDFLVTSTTFGRHKKEARRGKGGP